MNFIGYMLGMPLVLLGYFLSFIVEGLVRTGAWLAGRDVVEPEDES